LDASGRVVDRVVSVSRKRGREWLGHLSRGQAFQLRALEN
jgi:hypothetical protein